MRDLKTQNGASNQISGVAGVHFVAGELSRQNYIALPTVRNTAGIDIVASNQKFSKTVNIQVKTRTGSDTVWTFSKKRPKKYGDMVYVLVTLGSSNRCPEYYIVPYDHISRKYEEWQTKKPKRNNFRIKKEDRERYKGKWERLGLN